MASVISAIKAQMLTDLRVTATTTLVNVIEGPNGSPGFTQFPSAVVTWEEASDVVDMQGANDRTRDVRIEIYGKTKEVIELAFESISTLWESGATIGVLQALKVIDIYPKTETPAFAADDVGGVFSGMATYELIYRQ